ncbi:MAG: DUF1508 domain-containing protein, partial [Bacteroidota bacterium]
MKFQMFGEKRNGPFRFQLLDEAGQPLMNSISFPDRDATVNAMRIAVRQLRADNLEPSPLEGGFGWLMRSEEGEELMRSQIFPTETEASQALDALEAAARNQQQFEVSMTVRRTAKAFQALSTEVDYASFYDFLFGSPQGTPGFERFERADKEAKYYFHFNAADGQPLLYSRGFDTAGKRDKRIRTVLKSVDKAKRYERVDNEEGVYFILKASNGSEIGRSRMYADSAERDAAITALMAQAPTFAAAFPDPGKNKRKESYRLDFPSPNGAVGFESFRNPTDRRHYFHLNDETGTALLFSQAYLAKKSRDNGIRAVALNASEENRMDRKTDENGHYFLIRGGNRQAVARSRYFETEAERDKWIIWTQENIRELATFFGISLASATATETFSLEVENLGRSAAIGGVVAGGVVLGGASGGSEGGTGGDAGIGVLNGSGGDGIDTPPIET